MAGAATQDRLQQGGGATQHPATGLLIRRPGPIPEAEHPSGPHLTSGQRKSAWAEPLNWDTQLGSEEGGPP